MNLRRTTSQPQRDRRGIISMELVLTLPLLMLLLLGMFEFSFLMAARGEVIQACRAGARMAVLNGVQGEDVETEVGNTLGGRFGSSYLVQSQLGEHSGDEVVVTLRVPMTAAAPNLLWPVGYNIRGRELVAQARMLKE